MSTIHFNEESESNETFFYTEDCNFLDNYDTLVLYNEYTKMVISLLPQGLITQE